MIFVFFPDLLLAKHQTKGKLLGTSPHTMMNVYYVIHHCGGWPLGVLNFKTASRRFSSAFSVGGLCGELDI